MKQLSTAALGAALLLGGAGAALAEPPIFEINGYPVSRHQMIAVPTGLVRERAPASVTLGGMPASPHQVAVLTPRVGQIAEKLMEAAFSRAQFVAPSE